MSKSRTPPTAVQLHHHVDANAQAASLPENGNDARMRNSADATRPLASDRIISIPSTSNPGQVDLPSQGEGPEDQTYSAFANGFTSVPSLSSSFVNTARTGPAEPEGLQPAFEMSWNLTPIGNDYTVIPRSMELPDCPYDAYHNHLDRDQSTGLMSMQSVDESLLEAARDIDGQRSMEDINFASHGIP